MFFIDNNGVRDSTIKGRTLNDLAELLLEIILNVEMTAHAIPWYARVPSASNPSDSLSRDKCDDVDPLKRVPTGEVEKYLQQIIGQWTLLSSDGDEDGGKGR